MTGQFLPHRIECMEVWGGNSRTQKSLEMPGFHIWINSIPHANDEQGGDIYYISSCGEGNVARVSLADVSGHGETAGHMAKRLRRLMRKHINTLDQQRFASSLNKEFGKLASQGMYATALLTAYHAETDYLTICNAGHPHPLIYRASTNKWQVLDYQPDYSPDGVINLPLGITMPSDYRQFGLKLGTGDILLMYTDAILEAGLHRLEPRRQPLGESGLIELVNELPTDSPESLGRSLLSSLDSYDKSGDDLTLLVLAHNANNPPPPSWQERLRGIGRMAGIV